MTLFQPRTFLVAATMGLGVLAAPVWAETIAEIYAQAKQNDPKYLAMRSEFEASSFAVKEARGGLLPTVSYQVNRTKTNQNIVDSDNAVFATGQASYPTNDNTFSITQPIFKLAAWRNWRQSQASEKQAAAAFAASEQDLIMRTATAYLDVLAASDALALAQAEQKENQRQLELAEEKFKSGQATKVGLYEAQARVAMMDAENVMAANKLADKMQALREITGMQPVALAPLPKDISLTQPEPQNMEQWVRHALDSNLLLQARRQAVAVARGELDKRKAGHYPTLDLAYTNNQKVTGGSLFGGGSNVKTTETVLRLNIPIYEGGATSAQASQAAKHYETALQDLERDERQVERQARNAYMGVVGGAVEVKALDFSVAANESALELKAESYKAGLVSILAVLNASNELFSVRRTAAQSRYDFLLNSLRLKQAAGSLSEMDLMQIAGK